MKRILTALIAFLLATGPVLAQTANSWTTVAEVAKRSTVFIEGPNGSCSGFVINDSAKGGEDKSENVDLILTAAHCDGPALFAGGVPAKMRAKDLRKDLMVIEVENLNKPALKLADKNPRVGDEVVSFGFGYGLDEPMLRIAHIANDKTYIPFEGIGGPLMTIDASFVPGQSGGPVLNHASEVVMIVQLGTSIVGFGVGAEDIRDKVGRFFGEVK